MPTRLPRPPRIVDCALADPSLIERLVKSGGPYWTVQRYVRNLVEMAALSDASRGAPEDAPMF
ncbi:MAG: hypothetical protein H5U40_12050, partial [Polyangiaceae bacterium]|nr:hypothetical protein [Polyangiaceae bacterium]